MKNVIIAVLGGLLLTGCASTMETQLYPKPITEFKNPEPATINNYSWRVYTKDDLARALRDKNIVVYVLTPQGYRALTTNLVDLQRYLRDQKQLIAVMRQHIKQLENGL